MPCSALNHLVTQTQTDTDRQTKDREREGEMNLHIHWQRIKNIEFVTGSGGHVATYRFVADGVFCDKRFRDKLRKKQSATLR